MIGFHHKEAAVNGKYSKIERGVERCNQFYNEMKFWQIQSLYIWRKSHCWPSMNAIRILKLFQVVLVVYVRNLVVKGNFISTNE